MITKICTKCKQTKPLKDFPVNRSFKDGFRYECKECYKTYVRKYYHTNDEQRKKQNIRANNRHKKIKTEFAIQKLKMGCSKCGYNKCAGALHYHHINPKEKDFCIGTAIGMTMNSNKIQTEIDKCILLCANCHAEIEQINKDSLQQS